MSDSSGSDAIVYDGITCKDDASLLGVVIGVLLTVGIFGSYLPQVCVHLTCRVSQARVRESSRERESVRARTERAEREERHTHGERERESESGNVCAQTHRT
jgi:hypothetical protein